ncbi:MAG: hypothetical protein LBS55_00475 [Prevotellaceae bacterium]|jgi:hypothetical protein|nr:hypothetical protein [Prevotellaceae bacterium]
MKKIIVLLLILYGVCSAYAQQEQDCYDKIGRQAVVIDSLEKEVKRFQENNIRQTAYYQDSIRVLRDKNRELQSDLSTLEKFKTDKKNIDAQLNAKNDSIALLKNQLFEKDRQILTERQQGEQKANEENEKGKNEALENVVNTYKNKQFDDLIKFSTRQSVLRDKLLTGNNAEIQQVLSDLEKYFNAEELLAKKFDATQIEDTQVQLHQIKQESALLGTLKENLKYYHDFHDALKETIEKLIDLDKKKSADGDMEIQKLKFNDIANYVYNYYDYGNYPYLSAIVLEIIKRKGFNADTDISDLLRKL